MRPEFLHRRAAGILASQVHPSAGAEAPRHSRFLALAAGAAGLGWLALSTQLMQTPPNLLDERLVTGAISSGGSPLVWGVAAFAPLALAIFVSRTGRLRLGQGLAAGTLAALAFVLAKEGDPLALVGAAGFGWLASSFWTKPPVTSPRAREADLVATTHGSDGSTVAVEGPSDAVLGCDAEALLGQGFLSRVHVQDRVAFRKTLDDARDGEARCELRHVDPKTNATGHVAIRCEAVGEGVVCTSQDITAERERTTALENAAREAEELSRAKSHFIAVASHELRTPLNAIIGFSDLLRTLDGEANPLPHERRQEYAGLIHGAGHHLLEVVNDLLDMSRIEAGRYDLTIDTVDLRETTVRCIAMLTAMAAERGVRLVDVTDRSLPPVEADPRACRQMLINLLSNAIKFAPEGSTVSVGASSRGGAISLRVLDHGPGMCREDVARLGQPFTQVGSDAAGHTRGTEGAGLGLSIVKGLVELHDGTFEVRSVPAPAPDHGTEVVLTLPLRHRPRTETPCVVALPVRTPSEPAEGPINRSIEYGRVSA